MPAPSNYHQFPEPSKATSATIRQTPSAFNVKNLAKLWRPKGFLMEVLISTLSRVALRVVNRETGVAYSADELETKILQQVGVIDPVADWNDIENKPTNFPPSSHSHNIDDIDNFDSAVRQSVHDSTFPQLDLESGVSGKVTLKVDSDSPVPYFYFQLLDEGSPYNFKLIGFQFGNHSFNFNANGLTSSRGYNLPDANGTFLLTNAASGKLPGSYADDTAAAVAGVPVGFPYHTAGAVKVRLS